ncbi:MAG TPA: filamentous hemagglutinin N-terminal domain-containing protein [Leptolyngbyaceae cyanobacterium M33_DOE_097]|uniref:Filamentous hemagglutinin N-terminal domain-containing protein n=1 Tax=Oscillatoriales cyanobacterium SpSt-418 TaxID=2282169 RepID=A0A7C3PHQ1_9CYAN|nr:filamentous hemagglutinin N-terminal domain-containing protein [Leptolyngbyaceae cyanobacterium M33_DOE_097]
MICSRVPRCLNSQSIQTKNRLALQFVIGVLPLAWTAAVSAQSITPASNGTGTVVLQNGGSYTIQGGQLSGDRSNLFYNFERFGLNANETANFLSNPAVRNILGRVGGGDPSIIQGLIQVMGGNSNLYLINPAGILFGANASLNVPAAFTATTANGIGFSNGQWWDGSGVSNYAALTGTPNGFAFTSLQPGAMGASGGWGSTGRISENRRGYKKGAPSGCTPIN